LALANRLVTKESLITSQSASHQADILSDVMAKESEMIQSMGMQKAAFARWNVLRGNELDTQILGSDAQGVFSTTIKITRLFLQSAMLGLGAYLVLQKQMTPGAMIAGSILLGRALAPIEQLVNQWSVIEQGRNSYSSLAKLLGFVPVQGARTSLPKPRAKLEAQQLSVVPPGQKHATLKMVNFVIEPGSAVGVIGPSGSGKTTLARAITGVWRPVSGKVRLDGAALDQYDSQELGSYIGYLPQRVQLFDGTIRDNIARLSPDPDDRKVVEAAQKAGAHDMILSMPQGYDTSVSSGSGMLSGGQIQRIGLARAMYGDPVIIVLDEPNSNLDNAGNEALNTAIRSMKDDGKSILIMAHRPAAIQECDKLMVIEGGTLRAFGPKDDVLRQMVANHQDIQSSQTQAGVR
jgi:ATP-binding cassette subfamily C protein